MDFTDLFSTFTYFSQESLPIYYRAIRQDTVIWEGFQRILTDENTILTLGPGIKKFDPGSIGLISIDSKVDWSQYPEMILPADHLEEIMLEYENFLIGSDTPESLDQAACLAVALIEKFKVTKSWNIILNEILSRMKINSAKQFEKYWRTSLAITTNIIPEPDELFIELINTQQPGIGLGVFIHSVLCLPISDSQKTGIIKKLLLTQGAQIQARALKKLTATASPDLCVSVAQDLLEKYSGMELEPQDSSAHWENPEESAHFAFLCHQISEIADFAGDHPLALKFAAKSNEIFTALLVIEQIRQMSLSIKTGRTSEPIEELSKIIHNDALDSNVLRELSINGIDVNCNAVKRNVVSPVMAFHQAKKMKDAGNLELADEVIHKQFEHFSLADFQRFYLDRPEYCSFSEPKVMVRGLLDANLNKFARQVVDDLLEKNPTDIELNRIAAQIAERTDDNVETEKRLETIAILDDKDIEVKKALAKVQRINGKTDAAYQTMKKINSQSKNPSIEDQLGLANTAYECGRLEESNDITDQILKKQPEQSDALVLAGMCLHAKGDDLAAKGFFEKAIDLSVSDPRPWIILSEIQMAQGHEDQAIRTLKEGRISLPDNHEISTALAKTFIRNGSLTEALPILNSLSSSMNDLGIDLELIRAMKQESINDFFEKLEEMVVRHPECQQLTAEYGSQLIKRGTIGKGLEVLEKVKDILIQDPDWSIAFVEGNFAKAYQKVIDSSVSTANEKLLIDRFLASVLLAQPQNPHAKLLKAEMYIKEGYFDKAFPLISEALESTDKKDDFPIARAQAGLAASASGLEKYDLALAAAHNALALQPDWIGLKRILVEIQLKSGDINDAVQQADRIMTGSGGDEETILWYSNFLASAGKGEEAKTFLQIAVENDPDNPILQFSLVKQYQNDNEQSLANEAISKIKTTLENSWDIEELVRAANEFYQNGDTDSAIHFLLKAYAVDSSSAVLTEVVGFYRIHNELENALELLEKASVENGTDRGLNLAEIEILIKTRNYELATKKLAAITDDKSNLRELKAAFMPPVWKTLQDSTDPKRYLQTLLDFGKGDFTAAQQNCSLWIEAEPENPVPYVIAVEIALADGKSLDSSVINSGSITATDKAYFAQYLFLNIEEALDSKDHNRISEMFSLFEGLDITSIGYAAVRTRKFAYEGEIVLAEDVLNDTLAHIDEIESSDIVIRLGTLRSLAKAAAELSRWSEALEIISTAVKQNPKNLNLRNLYLASFVQALEYKNRTNDCHIISHQPWATFDNAQIKKEWQDLQDLVTSKPDDDSAHWFLRGNLAVDPTNDNIRSLASVPPTPEDAAALMAALRHTGQSKTAIKIANKFPGNNGVQFELAMCHAQSDPDQSIQILNSMVESKFAQPLLHFVLSTIHAKNGDAKAAAENMDYATSLWPMEQSWQIMAAEMWKKIGNLDRSIEHLDAAYQMDSNDAKIVLQLGKAYVSTRQHAKAIAILEGNVKENPNNSLTWQLLSEAYFLNGEFDAAISAAEKAGESDPFSNKPPLLIGKVFLQQMELEKAEEKAALAIELDAKDPEPRILLAKVYQAGGENARALASLELATKCETAGVETHLALVNLMNKLNGIASTIEILTDLTCKYPANAELLKLLADAQEQVGESKQAEINAKKALEIQPEEPELHRFLGRLQEHKGNLDQAAHYFGQAVAHDPADTEGYINLCHVLLKQKEYAKAREILEKGMNKAPGDVRLYLELARLLRDAKDYQGAESMLRKASEIAPRNLDVHRQLGAVLALNLVHQSQEVSSRI